MKNLLQLKSSPGGYALKELEIIINVREPHRRRAMLNEWVDTWIDQIAARVQHAPEDVTTPELKKQRYAEIGTQLAFGLLSEGDDRGAVVFDHAKDHAVVSVLVIRPRRKTKRELYGTDL